MLFVFDNRSSITKPHDMHEPQMDNDDTMDCDNFLPKMGRNLDSNASLLSRFLCICTAKHVMTPGPHWTIQGKFRMNVGSAEPTQMSTWFPADYLPVFLVSLSDGELVFYVHATNEMFSASCNIDMPKLPPETVLCMNYTEDLVTEGDKTLRQPRLLVFDVAMQNGVKVPCAAPERYTILRKLYAECFTPYPNVMKMFTLQWVGYYTHATAFTDGHVDVKHKVGGILSLTANVLRPIRAMKIKLPAPEVLAAQFEEQVRHYDLINDRNKENTTPVIAPLVAPLVASTSAASMRNGRKQLTPSRAINQASIKKNVFKKMCMQTIM